MASINVKPCPIAEFEAVPNLVGLLAEYAEESAIDALGPANPQFDTYKQLEALGAAHLLAAFEGEALVGFLVLLVAVVPHFGKCIATTESIFVAKDARKTGAGLKLLDEAKRTARSLGAVGLFVSAPTESRLAEVLDAHKAFRETNRVFFVELQ